jgi:aminoglycoside phosphotransferase (APT) family kinase protein
MSPPSSTPLRQGIPPADGRGPELASRPHGGAPAVEQWSGALLGALAATTGAPVAFAEEPTALDHAEGPWAYRCRLAQPVDWPGADPGPAELALRLAPDRADVEREAAVLRVVRRHLGGVARVRAVVEMPDGPDALCALVRDEVTGVALPELIGFNLHHSDALLHGFAAHQADIHRVPLPDLVGEVALAVVDAEEEVARIPAAAFPKERPWLDEHLPAPAPPVLCHGGYQPMSVFGPPPAEWEAHGGPGRGLVTTNWGAAVLAEPEFDVAYTLVALWSAPFFAKNRAERTAIKMIRNTLINTYKLGYELAHPLDPDRLRFWEAFHVLRGIARLRGDYESEGSPFAPPDRGTLPVELAGELPRRYQQLTRVR